MNGISSCIHAFSATSRVVHRPTWRTLQQASMSSAATDVRGSSATDNTLGKTVLVTGASSGIGAAVARRLAQLDTHKIIMMGRSRQRLQTVAAQIEDEHGIEPFYFCADVRDRKSIDAGLQNLRTEAEPPEILVHCSGLWSFAMVSGGHSEHFEELVDVHCKGTLNAVQAVLPAMLEKGRGHVVLLSSDAGRQVFPGLTVYSACKYWKEAFARGLRLELANTGIRVTTVQPGNVDTPGQSLSAQLDPEAYQTYGAASEAARSTWLSPENIADVVAFALSQPPNVGLNEILVQPRTEPIGAVPLG